MATCSLCSGVTTPLTESMVFCKTCADAIAECSVVLKEALASASEAQPKHEPTPIEVQVETIRGTLFDCLSSILPVELIDAIFGFAFECDDCESPLSTLDPAYICDDCCKDARLCRNCQKACADCLADSAKRLCFECADQCLTDYADEECYKDLCKGCGTKCDSCFKKSCMECLDEKLKACRKCEKRVCGDCFNETGDCCEDELRLCDGCVSYCDHCDAIVCEGCSVHCMICAETRCLDEARICNGPCGRGVCSFECSVEKFEWAQHADLHCTGCNAEVQDFCKDCLFSCPLCDILLCEECQKQIHCIKVIHGNCTGCSKSITACSRCAFDYGASGERMVCSRNCVGCGLPPGYQSAKETNEKSSCSCGKCMMADMMVRIGGKMIESMEALNKE